MYINDVIQRVKTYYPSEYDEREMYAWCDEVSSMIAVRDNCVYNELQLRADSNDCITLPEEVEFTNIVGVRANDTQLKKSNLKLSGKSSLNVGAAGEVTLTYLVPYKPIHTAEYTGEAIIEGDILHLSRNPFSVGDSIRLVTAAGERLVNATGIGYIVTDEYPYTIRVGADELSGLAGRYDITAVRIITEKTLCSAPYDVMYVDYLMAKIALYQRDYNMYNQFMTSFNSRMDAYKRWVINYLPQDGGKLINWWKGR